MLALGWILAISGVVWLAGALQTWTWGGSFVYLLNAIIRCVTGYLLIRHPDGWCCSRHNGIAALFIVGGLFRAGCATVIQYPRGGWTVFAGLVSVVLGVYLSAPWTATSTFFVGLAIGIDPVFDGASLVGFAGAIHSLPNPSSSRLRGFTRFFAL
jgi:uncharacterized membrane protein HdeD (DUF308 family)